MAPTVISDPHKYNNHFDAAQAFTDNIVDDKHADPRNYWAGTKGSEVYFVYDLGREAKITEVHLRNAHNGHSNDR